MPRRRPRKRDTRMDAALDAMRQFEFDPGLVRKTLKELLDVYSEEGWVFIEEYAYKLLIDTIIEKGEAEEAEAKNKVDSPQGNASSHVNNTPTTEPQSEVAPDCSNIQMSNTPSQANEGREPVSLDGEVRDQASLSNDARDHASPANESAVKISLPPQAEDKGVVSEDLNSEHNIQTEQMHNSLENHNAASEHPGIAPSYELNSPVLMDGFSQRKVRPCHGWIDSDEELDLVELTPSPLPESLRRMLDRVDGLFTLPNKKRKSRWDVKPDD